MFNPLNILRKFQSRIGKPIRPIIEFRDGGAVINIVTNTIEDGNVIKNSYQEQVWGKNPSIQASAVYVDGLYKGMGYCAGEEGVLLKIEKLVKLFKQDIDETGKKISDNLVPVLPITYTGLFSKAIDGAIIEKGSALKSSIGDKILWFIIGCLVSAVVVMSWSG
jgi:hypothetical protein